MRYIQIITKHLPLRRADSQSLPLPPRMNPLCCNVREWDKSMENVVMSWSKGILEI